MRCQLCGKSIGAIRRLVDREYCCAAHRADAVKEFSGDEDQDAPPIESPARVRQGVRTAVAMVGAFTLVMTIGILSFSKVQAGGRTLSSDPARSGWLASSARSVAPVTLHDDFRAIGPDWIPATVHSAGGVRDQLGAGEWTVSGGGVSPGILYLWKPTLDLHNYDFTFRATIARGGLGWAFRAADAGTFQAARLVLRSDGPDSSGCLQRFRRLNGVESERICEVQPVMLEQGAPYTVRVLVSDDAFTVSLNGVSLATWNDPRPAGGGIGFFLEVGDSATVHSVNVSERDSLLGRLAAYFSLIRTPQR